MAISSVTLQHGAVARAPWQTVGKWNAYVFHLLAASGAVTVVIGSYMTWATFYAGLIERNGVSGHGKYFIALATGGVLAGLLSSMRGASPLRLLVPAFGLAIAAFAFRDLRNLYALTDDPAAAFYVPGKGAGLYVVLAGAALMSAAILAAPGVRGWRHIHVARTAIAAAFTLAVTMLIAGGYGEYYLHFASGGHAHDHADALHPAHVLTFGGASLLLATFSAAMYGFGASRRTAPPPLDSHL